MAGFLGDGDLYIDRLTEEGAATGLRFAGRARRLHIKEPARMRPRVATEGAQRGRAVDAVLLREPARLSVVLDEIDHENLALAMLGEAAVLEQSAVSDQPVELSVIHDRWIRLGYKDVSGVAIAGLVEDADYRLNAEAGLIQFPSSGSTSDGQALTAQVSARAVVVRRVSGTVRCRCLLFLDGRNHVTGNRVHVIVHEGLLAPAEPVDLCAQDFLRLTLEGVAVQPDGGGDPWQVEDFSV